MNGPKALALGMIVDDEIARSYNRMAEAIERVEALVAEWKAAGLHTAPVQLEAALLGRNPP